MGNQVDKYKGLLEEFGPKICFCEFSLRVIGKFFRNSTLWKTVYRIKYKEINKYLCKKYSAEIKEWTLKTYNENDFKNIAVGCNIYVYWAQGFENAPEVVKKCLANLKKWTGVYPVVELNDDNLQKYVQVPEIILEKYKNGIIPRTQFSDIVRTNLLAQRGGIWIDSTVWVSNDTDFKKICNYSFYTIHHGLYGDYHICRGKWSGFFIASSKKSPYMEFVANILNEYWEKQNAIIDYLLIDCILGIGYDSVPEFKQLVDSIPINNSRVFELMEMIITNRGTNSVDKLLQENSYHKLTYKIDINANNQVVERLFQD